VTAPRHAALAVVVLASGCAATPAPAPALDAPPAAVVRPAAPQTAPARFVFDGPATQGGFLRGTAPRGTTTLTLDGKPVELAEDGGFIVAFDRDAPPEARLAARLADGTTDVQTLRIAPRAWDIERLHVPMRPPAMTTEEFRQRRAGELAQIAQARSADAPARGWRQGFIWPAQGRISGKFGAQRIYRGEPGAYHSGLDIAGGAGTTYVAPADGVVVLAASSPFTLEGNLLIIDHGHGLNSAFLHSSQLLVHEGDTVRQGQPIGRIGMTGRASGPHLHWSIKWNDARLDPLLFVPPRN
jgi:hypothetical protein